MRIVDSYTVTKNAIISVNKERTVYIWQRHDYT